MSTDLQYAILNKNPPSITMPDFTDKIIDKSYIDLLCTRDHLITNNLCKRGEGLVRVCDSVLRKLVTNESLERGMCKSSSLQERIEHLNCTLMETGWDLEKLVQQRLQEVLEYV